MKKFNLNRKRIIMIISICLAVVLVGAGGYAIYIYNKVNQAIAHMSGPSESPAATPTGGGGPTPQPTDKEEGIAPMAFMITGVDSRSGSDGSMNTDTMMLVALNPRTSSATVISIPRDLEVKPGMLSAHKINYFYPYFYNRGRETAIPNAKAFYAELFGVELDYMAVIDFNGFVQVVDELGGLTLDVDMDMRYVDNEDGTNINLKKGVQKLDGKNALDFVRYRKSNGGTAESSDLARNQRQQQVIKQLLDKFASFHGLANLGDVLEIIGNNVKTDVPASEMRSWLLSFNKLKPEQVDFIHLEGDWRSPYIVPKEEDMKRAIEAFQKTMGKESEGLDQLIDRLGLVPESGGSSATNSTYGNAGTGY